MPRRYLIGGLITLIAVAFMLLNKTYLSIAVVILALLPFMELTKSRAARRQDFVDHGRRALRCFRHVVRVR